MKLDLSAISAKVDGERVSGTVYVRNADVKLAKNQSKYIQGMFADGKQAIAFKVWGDYMERFSAVQKANKVIYVEGKVNVYNETISIVVTSASANTDGLAINDFIEGHDKDAIENEFYAFNKRMLSPAAYEVLDTILQGRVKERFFLEYAGMTMHDACPSGVANHTLKMLRIAEVLLQSDARLEPWTDLLILGINLHDIGKIKEMKDGDYRKNSFVTHREFGVELLYTHRPLITEKFNDDFFYRLISIIRGHHDEFEEKAKTVYAYIVHLIDMLDSQVTHILDVVEGEGLKEDSSGDKFVQARDAKWYV